MPKVIALRLDGGAAVCERCLVADRPLARMRGLLGRRELPAGEGILLSPASAVHSWFMRFPFDAAFLDEELVVLAVAAHVRPWRMRTRRGARSVLELAAGECERRGIVPGARLEQVPAT